MGDERIMSTVLKYSPDNFKNILSNIKSYNKMSDLFNIFNKDTNRMLNPAQQKMYEAYSEQLNNLKF